MIDSTDTLSPADRQALESKLTAFEQSRGAQLVVLMVTSTQPEDITSFAQRVGDLWKIGRQNIAMIERAMAMFNPFHRPGDAAPRVTDQQHAPSAALPGPDSHVAALTHELESLRAQLAIARAEAVIAHAPSAIPPSVAATVAPEPPPAALSVARKVRTERKPS